MRCHWTHCNIVSINWRADGRHRYKDHMKLRLVYRTIFLLLTFAAIPAIPLLVIATGGGSAEYVMKGTLDLRSDSSSSLDFGAAYVELLGRMVVLDFGKSTATGESATRVIIRSLGKSCKVMLPALVIAYLMGTAIGLGICRNPAVARIMLASRFAFFVPIVVFAYLLASLLSYAGISSTSSLRYLVAAAVLAIFPIYLVMQSVSRTVAEVSDSKPFRYHLAMGFSVREAWTKFCWRFLAIDYLAFAVHILVFMLGFLFFVEVPLGIDGMGQRFVSAVYRYDYPVIVGFCAMAVFMVGVLGYLVDLVRSRLDPRRIYV